MTRDGYAVAECERDGTIPSNPRHVHWIGTVFGARNVPDPDALMTFEDAREYAVTLVSVAIQFGDREDADPHDAYAVTHVTPDGWAPIMWATPDLHHPHHVRLTLHEGTRP